MKLSTIRKITKSKKDVYDITVENNHNFFCNNHLIHNCDYRGMVICRFKYQWQPENYIIQQKNLVDDTGIITPSFNVFGNIDFNKIYKKGDTIAQLVFAQTIDVQLELVDDLDKTTRGEGGFGSTDLKIHPKPDTSKVSLTEMYQKAGGVPVKPKYTEEIKHNEQ